MLEFKPAAIAKIKTMVQGELESFISNTLEGPSVRVSVVGGGCSGYSYDINFTDNKFNDDQIYEFDNIKIYVDPMSMQYLSNTTVDYLESFSYSGFHFDNPDAKRTCGCGASFGL